MLNKCRSERVIQARRPEKSKKDESVEQELLGLQLAFMPLAQHQAAQPCHERKQHHPSQ